MSLNIFSRSKKQKTQNIFASISTSLLFILVVLAAITATGNSSSIDPPNQNSCKEPEPKPKPEYSILAQSLVYKFLKDPPPNRNSPSQITLGLYENKEVSDGK